MMHYIKSISICVTTYVIFCVRYVMYYTMFSRISCTAYDALSKRYSIHCDSRYWGIMYLYCPIPCTTDYTLCRVNTILYMEYDI